MEEFLKLTSIISHLYPVMLMALSPPYYFNYSLDSITGLTQQMIRYKLKTKQTTGDGVAVNRIMVAESLDIARETYFAIVMDWSHQGPVMIGSPAGGVDIEEVAGTIPQKIFKVRGEERERGRNSGKELGENG